MQSSDKQTIAHIQLYCRKVQRTVKKVNADFEALLKEEEYVDSICVNISQIGELANLLSDEYRKSTANRIPWKDIIKTRNVIVHHYFSVDVGRIWETAINDIPVLDKFCEEQLEAADVHGFLFE